MLLCLQKETEWGVIEELLYFSQDERLRLQGKQKKDAKSDKMKSVGKERIPNQPLLIILQSMLLFNAEFLDSVEVYFWWWPLEFVGTWSKPLYTIILPVSSNPSTLFKSKSLEECYISRKYKVFCSSFANWCYQKTWNLNMEHKPSS